MYDVLIIGCGVVGAATAYQLSRYNIKLAVLEAENDVACGATKANSAIIHAGYDPKPGTLMAKLNVRGSVLTKQICEKLDVKYKQVGSLVVAFSSEELQILQNLYQQGIQNGVPRLELLTGEDLFQKEPHLSKNAVAGLYAPSAAIIEPWDFCLAMAQTAVQNGAHIFLSHKVTSIEKTAAGYLVHTPNKSFATRTILNAAGVFADEIHNMAARPSFTILPHSGQYYLLDKSEGNRVNHVIFQCPSQDGKGVLVAPTVHGNLIVGPNHKACGKTQLDTTAQGLSFVKNSAQKSVDGIDFSANIRNFCGIRATSDQEDFILCPVADAPGFFDLAGIKSPGLSAAAAIGEYACNLLKDYGISLVEKPLFHDSRNKIRFKELTSSQKAALIAQDSSYGHVVCRCETITEGEILACLHSAIPPVSLDGVKRRTSAGMGRCQGGFCGPKVLALIAREQNISPLEVPLDKAESYILSASTKEEPSDGV